MFDPEFMNGDRQSFDHDVESVMEEFALAQMTTHWRDFDRTPEDERLGSEEFWENVFPNVVVDMGISPQRAKYLCNLAKLDAQFEM